MSNRSLIPDLMKICACVAVVLIHVTAGPISELMTHPIYPIALVMNSMMLFAVPCFIFLSGLSLSLGYHHKTIHYRDFLYRRLKNIGVPYLIWCLLYYGINLVLGLRTFSWQGFAIAVFLGKANYHLYFVPIIMQLYVLYPLLRKAIKGIPPWLGLWAVMVLHLVFSKYIPTFPFRDRFFMSYLVYFVCGMYAGIYGAWLQNALRRFPILTWGSYMGILSLYIAAKYQHYVFKQSDLLMTFQLWPLFSMLSTLALYDLCGRLAERIEKWQARGSLPAPIRHAISRIPAFGQLTFTIYLAHPLVLLCLKHLYNSLHISKAGHFIANLVLAFPLSVLLSYLLTYCLSRYIDPLLARLRTATGRE